MPALTKHFSDTFYNGYKEQSGLSLVSTLWILTILSVLAAQLLYSIHIEQRTQRNFLDRAKLHYAAKAGFEWTLAVMRTDQTPFDSLGENWAEPIQGQVDDGVQTGNLLNYQVTVTDEASKVNINTADTGLITNLLMQAGAPQEDPLTQELANAIVEGRPYRTVRDLARVDGMTSQILYGTQQAAASTQPVANTQGQGASPNNVSDTGVPLATEPQTQPGLVDLATIHSIDASTDPDGEALVNLNTADEEQLTQLQTQSGQGGGQPVFSQAEAQSLTQQRDFGRFNELMDIRAVSDEIFNSIESRITTEDTNDNQGEEDEENDQVNINTADVETLESLANIDQGIAERILNHRDSQGFFQNIDAIKEVRMLTQQEFIGIVDKITLTDGETRSGLINVNTAPVEVLALLPGMDPEKAQAVVTRREQDPPDDSPVLSFTEVEITGNPFMNISELSEMQEIDFNTFRELADQVTYRSHGYRIQASGIDAAGRAISTCLGIIDRTGDEVVIQYWKQD